MLGKVDVRAAWLHACWSLELVSSSRTTSGFPGLLCVAVTLVTSCAFLLGLPTCSFPSCSHASAYQAGLKHSFLPSNNYF